MGIINTMRTFVIAAIATISSAVDIKMLAKSTVKVETSSKDGPTNGEMSEDQKDTLIQVLCPGPIVTSYSLSQGHSSTCNAGVQQPKAASFAQEGESAGNTEIA